MGNEFSDHKFEKRNYLNLAGSKIRTCSIGPELVIDPPFASVSGSVSIERGGKVLWEQPIQSGEAEMCHSLANIEHHHFKFESHRRPGDLHVHYYGAHSLSFGAGLQLADGDVMVVSYAGFGRPLRNPLRVVPGPAVPGRRAIHRLKGTPIMSKPRVAFLGLGIMGAGMARRILDAGFPLTVFNRNPGEGGPPRLRGRDGRLLPGAGRLAGGRHHQHGRRRPRRPGSLARQGRRPVRGRSRRRLHRVEHGHGRLGSRAGHGRAAKGCEFLDAPVTGSRSHAAAGELRFLVGGAPAALERVTPVLAAMGKTITHLGPSGSGALVKLINNFVCGVQVASLAEAVAMIERSGLDRDRALEVLTHGAPGSPLLKTIAARMTAADFTPNFFLRLMAKDLGYAIGEGRGHSVELATAAAALGDFKAAIAAGLGEKDMSAVVEPMRRR